MEDTPPIAQSCSMPSPARTVYRMAMPDCRCSLLLHTPYRRSDQSCRHMNPSVPADNDPSQAQTDIDPVCSMSRRRCDSSHCTDQRHTACTYWLRWSHCTDQWHMADRMMQPCHSGIHRAGMESRLGGPHHHRNPGCIAYTSPCRPVLQRSQCCILCIQPMR